MCSRSRGTYCRLQFVLRTQPSPTSAQPTPIPAQPTPIPTLAQPAPTPTQPTPTTAPRGAHRLLHRHLHLER